MSNLNIYLPPYTPDYSGASSALYELGGMIVLHDASGCTGNVLGYDEPRWEAAAESRALVYCSAYRHLEAILGQDDRVIERIVNAARSLSPRFIAVVGSPVPMLVGTDYEGIAREIEAKTGIPSFGFDTKGLEFYDDGYRKATIAIIKRYAGKCDRVKNRVNILGLTPIDYGNLGNDRSILSFIREAGYEVGCSFSMDFTLEDVARSASAEFNIAVSEAGVEVAEFMKRRYSIPYIASVPVGRGKAFMMKLKGEKPDMQKEKGRHRVLVIGEQVMSNTLREELLLKGAEKVDVANIFSHRDELLSDGDYPFVQEKDLMKIVNSGLYTDIIGDPLFKLLLRDDGVRFHENAHVGVSSKFHWNEVRSIVGEDMDSFLDGVVS